MAYRRAGSPSRSPPRAVDELEAVDHFVQRKSLSKSPRGSPPHQTRNQEPRPWSAQKSHGSASPSQERPEQREAVWGTSLERATPPERQSSVTQAGRSKSASESPHSLSSLSVSSPSSHSHSGSPNSRSASPPVPRTYDQREPALRVPGPLDSSVASKARTGEGSRMMGQLGEIQGGMQDLVREIKRLRDENEWLQQQLDKAEAEDAHELEQQQYPNQIQQLQRDLEDAEDQRSEAQHQLQLLEQQLEAEMDKTRQLRASISETHERLVGVPPPRPYVHPLPVDPNFAPQIPAFSQAPQMPSGRVPMSPREMFGAPRRGGTPR